MSVYNYIKIGGKNIYRPAEMNIEKTADIQAEYTTCTGKICGDVIGWKYSDDMNLQWDVLTDDMVRTISSLVGQETTMEFTDATGAKQVETILVSGMKGNPTRVTRADGTAVFTGIECEIRMIGASK